ncbi:cytochrome P450 [Kitasatospora sp. NPDC008050]|uniref:cytochrome P450 n=1 Tax=Kitasatospora sp. NPDC008050 TaxID=3364021 RepID=UPI0036E76504
MTAPRETPPGPVGATTVDETAAGCPYRPVAERLQGWRPEIHPTVPSPGEELPPGPRTPAALQSLLVWSGRNTYFPAVRARYGDTFTLRVAPIGRLVVLCAPEDVRTVVLGGPQTYPVGENNALFEPLLGKRTVLALDGPMHRSERRRMMPAVHGERLARVVPLMEQLAAEEVARWPVGGTVTLVDRMRELTLRVIVRTVLGVEEPARLDRFVAALRQVVDIKTPDMLMWVWPRLAGVGPWRRKARRLDHADELLFEEIGRRRRDAGREGRPDVLAALLDGGAGEVDDELVRVELVTLLAGGFETTAVASAWMFERLLRHPHVLVRLRKGLDDPQDEYRMAVVRETLRLRQTSYNVARRLTAPVELGGYRLPAGTFVWPSLAAIHSDPGIWGPDAAAFRPERWLEPDPPLRAFLPFGGGVHRCLGAQFAEVEMEVILRTVLRHVELRPDRWTDEPATMRNIVLVPQRGARVRVVRRLGG